MIEGYVDGMMNIMKADRRIEECKVRRRKGGWKDRKMDLVRE